MINKAKEKNIHIKYHILECLENINLQLQIIHEYIKELK